MNEKPIIPPRTFVGWCIVGANGDPHRDTLSALRSTAILSYNQTCAVTDYRTDRRNYGIRVVRCTITTEV